jgi:synaptic vesicle membrane protein VAT-1
MKKVVIEKGGDYNQLKIKEFPNPTPGKDEVLIETRACGINFADCLVRMGLYQSAREFVGWPITPGFEISGIVTAVGEDVKKFTVGQKVIAMCLFGGYTTHLVAKEDRVYLLPDMLNFAQGAALPAVFLTAYYALFQLAHPRKNDVLLIHSAAGGVGSTLVQMAKLAGCRVLGVVGAPHKVAYVKSLGADLVIDKSTQNLWQEAKKWAPEGFDVILDANGAETLRQDYQHLNSGGKLVVYGFHSMFSKGRGKPNWFKLIWDYLRTPRFNPLYMTSDNHSILAFNLSYLMQKKEVLNEALGNILEWILQGKIIPPRVTAYPLEQVAQAQRDLESGQTQGKLVLTTHD